MSEREREHDHEATAADVIQAAAIEAIKAMRAFLDVAESVVREPGTAATVGKAFAEAAASAFRPPPRHDHDDEDHADDPADDAGGRIRRIHLSD